MEPQTNKVNWAIVKPFLLIFCVFFGLHHMFYLYYTMKITHGNCLSYFVSQNGLFITVVLVFKEVKIIDIGFAIDWNNYHNYRILYPHEGNKIRLLL